jgi:hypothetical protein
VLAGNLIFPPVFINRHRFAFLLALARPAGRWRGLGTGDILILYYQPQLLCLTGASRAS